MELLLSSPLRSKWRRYWRRKRYERLDGGNFKGRKRYMKVIRIGDSPPRRVWKMRAAKKLKVLKIIACASPLKLLRKIKDAYISMMVSFAANIGYLNGGVDVHIFGNKRIPRARQAPAATYTQEEFDAKVVYEIYKALKGIQ